MNFTDLILKLNTASDELSTFSMELPKTKFYFGDFIQETVKICAEVAPFGKIAVILSESEFFSIGRKLSECLKKSGNKPFNIVLDNSDIDGDALKALVNSPEDVRAVVFTEVRRKNLVACFASLKKIPIIYGMETTNFDGLLEPVSKEKDGIFSCIKTDAPRHIVICENTIFDETFIAEEYVRNVVKCGSYIDYVTGALIREEVLNEKLLYYARLALESMQDFIKLNNREQVNSLLFSAALWELTDSASGGRFSGDSAINACEELIRRDVGCTAGEQIEIFARVIGLYALYLSKEYIAPKEYPNYTLRAKELSELTGKEETLYLIELSKQLEILNKTRKNVETIKNTIRNNIAAISKIAIKVRATYFALGGTDKLSREEMVKRNEKIAVAVRLCGDLPNVMNVVTLARESGMTELIGKKA